MNAREMLYDAIENGYISESTLLQECLEYLSVDDCEEIANTFDITDYYEEDDDFDDMDED